jgi:hypothetical protein
MGTFINKTRQQSRRAAKKEQTCKQIVCVRLVDLDAWEEYVHTLPSSYEMEMFKQEGPFAYVYFSYTAKGANGHDLGLRLRASNIPDYTRGDTNTEVIGE